jgi:hypothetical protein
VLSFDHALPTIIYLLVMQGEADALNRSLPKSDELSQDGCNAVGGAKRRTANGYPSACRKGRCQCVAGHVGTWNTSTVRVISRLASPLL